MLLKNGYLRNLLFIDIETVPNYGSFEELSEEGKLLWEHKNLSFYKDPAPAEESYLNKAGIYAEFGKVICISIGFFRYDAATNTDSFRVKSFFGDDEKMILSNFIELLNSGFCKRDLFNFCGHNIKEFDIPFLCRRILINQLPLPNILDISGKKPWEVNDIDTLHLWRFGDYKNYTSLRLLAYSLGIPSPKEDIEGKDICKVYYQENGIKRIVKYCQQDVISVARLLMRFRGEADSLLDEEIIFIEE